MTLNAEQIYLKYIKDLSVAERLRLLEITARDLAGTSQPSQPKRSLLELEGLGAEIWQGVDPQEYVNKLRQVWDDNLQFLESKPSAASAPNEFGR